MSTANSFLSMREFERLPDDGYRHELSGGVLVREPRPGARHGHIVLNVATLLRAHVQQNQLGVVLVESGFILRNEPGTVRGPDVSFIAADRLPSELPVGFVPFAPDLAIEILSPSNTASEIERKVLDYLDAGTRMVWVIDPDTQTARSYRGNEAVLVRADGELVGGDVVPGYTARLADLFAG